MISEVRQFNHIIRQKAMIHHFDFFVHELESLNLFGAKVVQI